MTSVSPQWGGRCDGSGRTGLEAVGQDCIIEPVPAIHAAPGWPLCGFHDFHVQRIGEGRHH